MLLIPIKGRIRLHLLIYRCRVGGCVDGGAGAQAILAPPVAVEAVGAVAAAAALGDKNVPAGEWAEKLSCVSEVDRRWVPG